MENTTPFPKAFSKALKSCNGQFSILIFQFNDLYFLFSIYFTTINRVASLVGIFRHFQEMMFRTVRRVFGITTSKFKKKTKMYFVFSTLRLGWSKKENLRKKTRQRQAANIETLSTSSLPSNCPHALSPV